MPISVRFLLKNTIWTVGSYGLSQLIRLAVNIVLARLLAPELFGIMVIVNSLRSGMELFSDFGIGQNIVVHKHGNDPEFYNTAWTVQAIRGVGLWLVALCAAAPIAKFYAAPILFFVVPLTAFGSVLSGFWSVRCSPSFRKGFKLAS